MRGASCRICGNSADNRAFVATEMMFGTKETFEYSECAVCGCVQISEIPADLHRHYPPDYYSFGPARVPGAVRYLKRSRARHAMGQTSVLGRLLSLAMGPPAYVDWIRRSGLDQNAAVLDVGAGAGDRVANMADAGFTNLLGLEPNLAEDLELPGGTRVVKASIEDVSGAFDLIMFHHSLEHVPDQHEAIGSAARLLAPGGTVLIRVPVADSYAWLTYRDRWVQLDPPRHLYLHTQRSMEVLASGAGLQVDVVVHDSTPFQLWGSELYMAGTALNDRPRSRLGEHSSRLRRSSRAERAKVRELNARSEGDQAAFYLSARP